VHPSHTVDISEEYNSACMNFLAHLYLARSDDELMLGGLLGDFVRGQLALRAYPPRVQTGIKLHRRIDRYTDSAPEVKALKRRFPREFRRYAGIVLDLAFDHELARRWPEFSDVPLDTFDVQVRELLGRFQEWVPESLDRFMRYADRRGLFASYRSEEEMLHSLAGIGTRLQRANPLGRAGEIWPQLRQPCRDGFSELFPDLQVQVDYWLKRRSTTTGS
jgi:acyl carrier protein phosphodiesterase